MEKLQERREAKTKIGELGVPRIEREDPHERDPRTAKEHHKEAEPGDRHSEEGVHRDIRSPKHPLRCHLCHSLFTPAPYRAYGLRQLCRYCAKSNGLYVINHEYALGQLIKETIKDDSNNSK